MEGKINLEPGFQGMSEGEMPEPISPEEIDRIVAQVSAAIEAAQGDSNSAVAILARIKDREQRDRFAIDLERLNQKLKKLGDPEQIALKMKKNL